MKTELIAEIGQAHDGSLGIAHSYVDALAGIGVHAIKWQTHIALAESSAEEPFRVEFSYQDKTRYDYWKRMEFTLEEWKELKTHCDELGVEFLSSPFSNAAVDLLEEVGVRRYKIGSGEANNFLLLERIAQTNKPILLSSGLSSFEELDQAVDFFKDKSNQLTILQCTTAYPISPEEWGGNVLSELKERYGLPVGFSDHSGDIFACISAATLGATVLEFHVVFDKKMFGPDSKSSLTLDQVERLVSGVRQINRAQSSPIDKSTNQHLTGLKKIFEKSLALNKSLPKGHFIRFEDLEAKKPSGMGIKAANFREVIGRTLNKDIDAWSFLKKGDLNE